MWSRIEKFSRLIKIRHDWSKVCCWGRCGSLSVCFSISGFLQEEESRVLGLAVSSPVPPCPCVPLLLGHQASLVSAREGQCCLLSSHSLAAASECVPVFISCFVFVDQ